jgi:hypothetical protein
MAEAPPRGAAPRRPGGWSRRARRRRAVVLAFAFVLVVAGAVIGIVAALGALDTRGPVIARCDAHLTKSVRYSLAPDQADNAALIAAIATHRRLPARAATIAIATGFQESKLRNITYGDRDSLGIFQQRPSQGWGTAEQVTDPVYATNTFYDVLVTIDGYETLTVTDAAQRVQRSAFPNAYADHEQMARAYASALTGYSRNALVCQLPGVTEAESATAAEAVQARLARDFVQIEATRQDDGTVVVDARSLAPGASDEDATRLAWAVAQWAVATADTTGASLVVVDGMVWDRAAREQAWAVDDSEAGPGGPGLVVIR